MPIRWYSDDGSTGYVGHIEGDEAVPDRLMTFLEYRGGGSAVAGFIFMTGGTLVGAACLFVAVQIVKWMWGA